MKKIFITGGHLTPALAVMSELSKEGNWKIFFVGRKFASEDHKTISAEFKLLSSNQDITFLSLTTGRLQRSFTRYTIPSILKIPIGLVQSSIWLIKNRPDVVLSFGGYVAVPVVLCAWILRIPIATHEQTLVPGLANQIVAKFSGKIFLSWKDQDNVLPKSKTILTGNPVRSEIYNVQTTDNYKKFKLVQQKFSKNKTLLIMGGNQGSMSINNVLASSLPELLKNHLVIHSTGTQVASALPQNGEKYFPFTYIGPNDIGWVLKESDIVITRSGANTICDLAALGKIAILIPLPWSGGSEQQKNAQMLQSFGGSIIIPQSDLKSETLLEEISKIEQNFSNFEANAKKAKVLISPDSAQKIASEVEKMIC